MILAIDNSRKRNKRKGATVIEMAVVSSIFILLMFGMLEYCMIVYHTNVVENAAREGARYAVVNITDTTMVADTQTYVKSMMMNVDTKDAPYTCNVYKADANGNNIGSATSAAFGEYVCVDITVTYTPMTPGLLYLKTFTIRSKCNMISEAN